MSSSKSLPMVGLTLACLAFIGLVGCSSDETVSNGAGTRLYGDDYENNLVQVYFLTDSTMDVISNGLEVILQGTGQDFNLVPIIFYGDGADISLASGNGAWVVASSNSLTAGVSDSYIDSLQFWHGALVGDNPDGADGITLKHHWTHTNGDTSVSYVDYETYGDLQISSVDGDLALVSGVVAFDVHGKTVSGESTVWETYDIDGNVSNLTIDRTTDSWNTGCPSSGQISLSATYTRQVDDAEPEVTEYTFVLDFDNGIAEVTATSGQRSVTTTNDFCGSSN